MTTDTERDTDYEQVLEAENERLRKRLAELGGGSAPTQSFEDTLDEDTRAKRDRLLDELDDDRTDPHRAREIIEEVNQLTNPNPPQEWRKRELSDEEGNKFLAEVDEATTPTQQREAFKRWGQLPPNDQ